jgi:hypothetical protein
MTKTRGEKSRCHVSLMRLRQREQAMGLLANHGGGGGLRGYPLHVRKGLKPILLLYSSLGWTCTGLVFMREKVMLLLVHGRLVR